MPASNATFVGEIDGVRVRLQADPRGAPAVGLPGRHARRRARWRRTPCRRRSGWDVVPLTILREGPHGPGMVQLWREPDPGQDAVDLVPGGRVPDGYRHVFDGLDESDRADLARPRGHRRAAPDGGLRRRRQQRRPQGRPRAGDARRAPVRRRPRRHLPRRAQAAHGAVGLGRRAADRGGDRRGRDGARRAARRPGGAARGPARGQRGRRHPTALPSGCCAPACCPIRRDPGRSSPGRPSRSRARTAG